MTHLLRCTRLTRSPLTLLTPFTGHIRTRRFSTLIEQQIVQYSRQRQVQKTPFQLTLIRRCCFKIVVLSFAVLKLLFVPCVIRHLGTIQEGITLDTLLSFGTDPPTPSKLIDSATFLYKELPIRLAKRVKELESLPYGLSQTAPVGQVKEWYVQSFRDCLSSIEPSTVEEEQSFTNTLERILHRHNNVLPMMAQVQRKHTRGTV